MSVCYVPCISKCSPKKAAVHTSSRDLYLRLRSASPFLFKSVYVWRGSMFPWRESTNVIRHDTTISKLTHIDLKTDELIILSYKPVLGKIIPTHQHSCVCIESPVHLRLCGCMLEVSAYVVSCDMCLQPKDSNKN